jgi:hypothetical protein
MALGPETLATALAALLIGQAAAPTPAPAVPSAPDHARYYATRFCATVALNDVNPGLLRQLDVDWDARPVSDVEAQAFRPDDVDTPGQMTTFAAPDAPKAFIEPRGGMCSLVYPLAHAPEAAMDEFKSASIPLHKGAPPTPWSRVANKRLGGHGPLRYFLPTSDDGRSGLCAAIYDDVRLHDATPATVIRVQSCRLSKDETTDNG